MKYLAKDELLNKNGKVTRLITAPWAREDYLVIDSCCFDKYVAGHREWYITATRVQNMGIEC